MPTIVLALLLGAAPPAGPAPRPGVVIATNAERDTAYQDLAECEVALERTRRGRAGADGAARAGTLFNAARGNISRCEVVHGEPTVVVYPRGHAPAD